MLCFFMIVELALLVQFSFDLINEVVELNNLSLLRTQQGISSYIPRPSLSLTCASKEFTFLLSPNKIAFWSMGLLLL